MPLTAYCYLRVVGRGSYGEVTLVRHRRDGRQYVIKKLNLQNASSRELRAAEQEAQLLSQLKHPNIVTYKESWEGGDGLLYIVMGFCEGGDLYRKLKEQKGRLLSESQVVEWFVQIAMALQLPPMPKDYSPELAEIIRTMLSKRPEERPSVRSILRQPYIKRQISLFLETTKAKTSKNNIKNGDSKSKPVATVVSGKAELSHEAVPPQPHSSEGSKTYVMGEDKYLSQEKPVVIGPLKTPTSLKGHTYKPDISNTAESLATISRVNIDILPAERRNSVNNSLVQENKRRHLDASNELEGKCIISQVKERLQDNTKSSAQPGNRIPTWSIDYVTGERNDPVKALQPLNKDQNLSKDQFQETPPRLSPSLSTVGKVDATSAQKDAENQRRVVTGSLSSSRNSEISSSKDRPLSARERRRLKQSQEEIFPSGPSVRRVSLSPAGPGKPQEEGHPTPAQWLSSDHSVAQERKLTHCLSEDELSSSASSTDKLNGDSKEEKGHTNEMSDLVQLMTQTLKLDSRESYEDLPVPEPVSEFKLHRKYQDTLILHGKVAEGAEELHFKELPSAIVPGSEKIRRIVEVLRADVIRGLGIQLLEQVYDILEEEDELEREAPDTQAQQPWLTGPAALQHVGSSRTGAQTHVPCIGRRTLNHCTTREARIISVGLSPSSLILFASSNILFKPPRYVCRSTWVKSM
ncbi:serine/threonine-protein kinase Nek4 isoform X17 [Kogia breviceps]|uniref:serine/threonine-protein kinase Nek4 isoform X17 n=1 Tax=Kogia breviceps TaxID=27615 RepID=UPI0034D37911